MYFIYMYKKSFFKNYAILKTRKKRDRNKIVLLHNFFYINLLFARYLPVLAPYLKTFMAQHLPFRRAIFEGNKTTVIKWKFRFVCII
jgi:hypothetical protein